MPQLARAERLGAKRAISAASASRPSPTRLRRASTGRVSLGITETYVKRLRYAPNHRLMPQALSISVRVWAKPDKE